jgi:hypothetical protein
MKEKLEKIRSCLQLIETLEDKYGIEPGDSDDPLFYTGVAESNIIKDLSPDVEKHFGKAYKPAGEGAFFKNFFDKFVKEVGGARKEQTLFRKDIDDQTILYCAFWPWGTDPVRTSIRIGLLCFGADERSKYEEELDGEFV